MRRTAGVVFRKEVLDNLRDRRTLMAALFYPLLGPAMLLLVVYAVSQVGQEAEKNLRLPVVGAENAPNLVHFLGQRGVEILAPPEDPEEAVRSGDLDLVLVIPEDFPSEFREGLPAAVQLIRDESRRSSRPSVGRTEALLRGYGAMIGSLRLQVRGVDPRVMHAVLVEPVDLSTQQSQAANFLSMAPYFIIFSIFVGGMYLAIDSTAGERERGSLEPLLTNPVPRKDLVSGKMLATLLFTAVAVAETLLGFAVLLQLVPLEEYIGVKMSLPPIALVYIFLIILPMMWLAVSLQFIVASSTKSFKEAQNYITFLTFVPAIPALILSIIPVKVKLWQMGIPMVGQQQLINQILRAEEVNLNYVGLSAVVTIGFAAVCTLLVIHLYRREKLLFQS